MGANQAAPQGHLAHHELAVVLAHSAFRGREAGVAEIGAGGPLPGRFVELVERFRPARRRVLPLRFRRQALAGPARIGVGLVIADVDRRRVGVERLQSSQAEHAPAKLAALPIERRLPAFVADPRPAVGEPELRPLVAAVFDEREPFAIGDETAGQPVGPQQRLVPRTCPETRGFPGAEESP